MFKTSINTVSILSGPAMGIVAGSTIPNYCIMCDTANIARVMEKMGEGMRIHISSVSKVLLEAISVNQEECLTLWLESGNLII